MKLVMCTVIISRTPEKVSINLGHARGRSQHTPTIFPALNQPSYWVALPRFSETSTPFNKLNKKPEVLCELLNAACIISISKMNAGVIHEKGLVIPLGNILRRCEDQSSAPSRLVQNFLPGGVRALTPL